MDSATGPSQEQTGTGCLPSPVCPAAPDFLTSHLDPPAPRTSCEPRAIRWAGHHDGGHSEQHPGAALLQARTQACISLNAQPCGPLSTQRDLDSLCLTQSPVVNGQTLAKGLHTCPAWHASPLLTLCSTPLAHAMHSLRKGSAQRHRREEQVGSASWHRDKRTNSGAALPCCCHTVNPALCWSGDDDRLALLSVFS